MDINLTNYLFMNKHYFEIRKIIVIVLSCLSVNFAHTQFKVKTIENDYSTRVIASCKSTDGYSTIEIGTENEVPYLAIYLELHSFGLTEPKEENIKNIKIRCGFFSNSAEEHVVYTYPIEYEKTKRGNYWIYLNTEKLINYFKKYTTVSIKVDYGYNNTYKFSLSGFTSSYNKIFGIR
jgi:hypothetical protein